MIRSCGESGYLTPPSISERFSGCGGCAITNTESIEEMDSGDDICTFEEPDTIVRSDSEDRLAGGIIAGVSIVALIWYCFVLVNIFFVLKKLPIFVIFFSQGIGDIGFLLNNIWLAVDIIVGPSSLMKDSKIYSIVMNVFARPVLFHFLFIAMIVYTCTFVTSAVLLPVFSFDLWSNMIPRKLRKTSNVNVPSRVGARLTKNPSGLAPTRRFSTLDNPVLTVEGL
uniref:Uncharacterized protein n=1 Tax=Plectus sambesii TaxID=2011161 RepID=A0A914WHW6_9BILA